MKHVLLMVFAVTVLHLHAIAQSSIVTPAAGYTATDFFHSTLLCADPFGIEGSMVVTSSVDSYGNFAGLSIYNLSTQQLSGAIPLPTDSYFFNNSESPWVSFITLSPDGSTAYVGFTTSGCVDDHIYGVDLKTGTWTWAATLGGNFDMHFYNGIAYAVGLGTTWNGSGGGTSSANGLFELSLTGSNSTNIPLIKLGGNSVGFAFDAAGNVYFGTNYYPTCGMSKLYRFSAAQIASVVSGSASPLPLSAGTLLSDLAPDTTGPYGIAVDRGGNVYFNQNNQGYDGSLATIEKWNGVTGTGQNFSPVASASSTDYNFLTYLAIADGCLWASGYANNGIAQIDLGAQTITGNLQGTVMVNGTSLANAVIDYYQQGVDNSGGYFITRSDGSFDLPATSGTWTLTLDYGTTAALKLVSPWLTEIIGTSETISGIAFDAQQATGTIAGVVATSRGKALSSVSIGAWATINGVSYSETAQTGSDGYYSIPVISGGWTVAIPQPGFSQQTATVSGTAPVVVNFTEADAQSDASLSSLSLSNGTLSPVFSSSNQGPYSDNVSSFISTITVTAAAAVPGATVSVKINNTPYTPLASGSATLPLNTGSNSLAVQVISADTTVTTTYRVNIVRASAMVLLDSEGDPAPGISDTSATFLTFGSPAINNAGDSAFQATITGTAKGTKNTSGIWLRGANGPELIVRTGTGAIPFTALGDPVLNNSGQVAFLGTLKVGGKGIWTNANLSGTLQEVARINGPVPDATGVATIPKAKFASFTQIVLPDAGGVVFLATLGGVASTANEGIWAVDPTGLLKRIVGKGDTVMSGGAACTITALELFSSTAGTTAQTRSFNGQGTLNSPWDLIYRVTLKNPQTKKAQQAIQRVEFQPAD